jgi:hypothetical protein
MLVIVASGDHRVRSGDTLTSKACPIQDWMRNVSGPITWRRAGSVMVKNCWGATLRNSCTIPEALLPRPIHHPHAALGDFFQQFVVAEGSDGGNAIRDLWSSVP